MKFFNWVHKRFHHHPLPKDECTQMVESATSDEQEMVVEANGNYYEKEAKSALLKKAVLVDALDGWKDGILAIGTFGFDPLKPFANNDYLVLDPTRDQDYQITPEADDFSDLEASDDSDDHDSTDGSEEENPLMCLKDDDNDYDDDGDDEFMNVMCRHEVVSDSDDDDDDIDDYGYYKKKVGRTTLADLFLADGDTKKVEKFGYGGAKFFSDDEDVVAKCDKKKYNLLNTKKGLSFAKKLIPKVKDDTSPIKNIQQLMRRMLKRKIHPELLDVKTQKSGGGVELISNAAPEKVASEYVSLLAMQGVPSEI